MTHFALVVYSRAGFVYIGPLILLEAGISRFPGRKAVKKSLIILLPAVVLILAACGGPKTVVTEPEPATVPEAPPPPSASPDPQIGRVHVVLRHFGRLTRKYMSYEEYSRNHRAGDEVASVSPDWFYDTYSLDLNQDGYWAKVHYQTAERAITRDPRIESLLGTAPRNAIDMSVETPAGRKYVFSDAEADGVLDYAALQGRKAGDSGFDWELRDRMQATYSRLLAVIKGYYAQVPRAER